ncbi:MAG: type III pantothenate kinase [Atopobiaceae bacterium]|nr:type III pantothenate kinase [Atopobiaceae bacterium]
MLLCIDVGNTQTTIGLICEDHKLCRQWRMATSKSDTADQIRATLHGFFTMLDLDIHQVVDSAIASVVPTLGQSWERLLRDITGHDPLMVDATRDCGIDVALPYPQQIGADRIANAVSARDAYGAPVIVVDFGTATNIDVVDRTGAFRGGVIMPGLMLSANALFSYASRIASVPMVKPAHALGDTTDGAVQSGLVIGAAAMAEGLVSRIVSELGEEKVKVVATGGLASVVSEATDLFDTIDPDLTIRGIYQIWKHREEKRGAQDS